MRILRIKESHVRTYGKKHGKHRENGQVVQAKKNSVIFLIGKHRSPKFRTRRGRFFAAAEASGRKWRRWRGRWRGARTQRTCWRGRARPLSQRTRPKPIAATSYSVPAKHAALSAFLITVATVFKLRLFSSDHQAVSNQPVNKIVETSQGILC